jgi:hypothetical protein
LNTWKHDPNPHAFTWCFLWTHFLFTCWESDHCCTSESDLILWGSFAALSVHSLRIYSTTRIQKAWKPAKYHYSYIRKLWDIHKREMARLTSYTFPPSPLPLPTLEVSTQHPALFNSVFCVKHTPLQRNFLLQMGGFKTCVGTQLQDQVSKISLLSGILLGVHVCFFGLMLRTLATIKQSHVQMVFLNFVKSPHPIFRKTCQKLSNLDTEVMEVAIPNWEFEQIYSPA